MAFTPAIGIQKLSATHNGGAGGSLAALIWPKSRDTLGTTEVHVVLALPFSSTRTPLIAAASLPLLFPAAAAALRRNCTAAEATATAAAGLLTANGGCLEVVADSAAADAAALAPADGGAEGGWLRGFVLELLVEVTLFVGACVAPEVLVSVVDAACGRKAVGRKNMRSKAISVIWVPFS